MDKYYLLAEIMYNNSHEFYIKNNTSDFASERRKEFIVLISILLKEICESEKVSTESIKCIGSGATSYVYQIGNKVFKVGINRNSPVIPNNPYIVKPLLRMSFEFTDEYKETLFLELTEKVELVTKETVTEDEIYALYKALRDMDIEWVDIDERNVGRLLKDNDVYWREDIDPDKEATLLEGEGKEIKLKKGDLVIIDSDFMYKTDRVPDFTPYFEDDEWSFYKRLMEFRKRYEKESKKKKSFLIGLKNLIRINRLEEENKQGRKL